MASQNLDLKKLLPLSTRNEMLDSLMSNMFNNFVSEEHSVLINGRVGKAAEGDASIQASSLDREINALIPALYTKVGAEENIFTFEDILNKLNALDTDTDNLRTWMAEQSFNYSLPVNYDKFINYTNYYWIGKELLAGGKIDARPYNSTVEPEFYLISKPGPNDKVKMDVDLATNHETDGYIQLWANGRPPETFTISFISNSTFEVTSDFDGRQNLPGNIVPVQVRINNGPLLDTGILPSVVPTAQATVTLYAGGMDLVSFVVTVGSNHFASGDVFTLKITYFTSNIVVTLDTINPIGKGAISGSKTVSPFAIIDGKQLTGGERVLVKDNHDGTDGIYHVYSDRKWERTSDAAKDSNLVIGSSVYVLGGNQYGTTWEITSEVLNVMTSGFTKSVYFELTSSTQPSNINEWQRVNYWIHRDDFDDAASLGVTFNKAIRANRPIVEYRNSIEKNLAKDSNGRPCRGANIGQDKTEFNQIPQFNLYRYDGTHQGSTSSLFYYVEDPDYPTDLMLRRRVKTTPDYDFIFGMGIKDAEGRLLYYKDNDSLVSVWREGVVANTSTQPVIWSGGLNKGHLALDEIASFADNQEWIISALNASTFSVTGSRSGRLADATVGIPYPDPAVASTAEVKFTISNGTDPFTFGENFSFIIHTRITPRYVKKLADGSIVNYPGGITADLMDGTADGAWMNPARMFENLERETRSEINFGDLLNHTRNVIKNQNGFIGTSYGINNIRTLDFNPGLGGSIREFSSNFPLLVSMMIQNDVSPLTLLDFAEQQYLTALSSIDQFMINDYPAYLSLVTSVTTSTISPNNADIQALEIYFEQLRKDNILLKNTFNDTTAGVACWPVTLPMMGMCEVNQPTIRFDNELGIDVIVHHDGHVTPVAFRDTNFDMQLVKSQVLRSDASTSAGIFSNNMPLQPYARQLWYKTSTTQVLMFNVTTDAVTPNAGNAGDIWFVRATGEFKYWDTVGKTWLSAPNQDALSYWVEISTANIRNSLILAVENKLFAAVHPSTAKVIDILSVKDTPYAEIELAKYSAKYGYDTYVPDYNAADAFTWNYHGKYGRSRWYDVYKAYFSQLIATTCRPNLEPWKFGTTSFAPSVDKPAGWDAVYPPPPKPTSTTVTARVVSDQPLPLLTGEIYIDGIVVSAGDKVLVTAQTDQFYNGLYTVGLGGWTRATAPAVDLAINITEGDKYLGTQWVCTTTGVMTDSSTIFIFEQARVWPASVWTDVKAYRDIHYPGLKLCVNIYNDQLLPPYVSSSSIAGNEALSTIQPSNAEIVQYAASYSFTENGPIETTWRKSIEYYYGLARSYFRTSPLSFLNATWGDTYISVEGNVRVERNLMAPLPSSKFLLHGEKLNIINSYLPSEVEARFDGLNTNSDARVDLEVTHCSDNLTVMSLFIDGIFDSYLEVNKSYPGLSIYDNGIPFELGEKLTAVIRGESVTYSHTPAIVKKFKGLGQIFTNLLRFNYVDTSLSTAVASYRGWAVKLVHRLGAMIRPDTLTINTTQGDLPSTGFNVMMKKSIDTQSLWISALRVQLIQQGTRTLNADGLYIPAKDASDWIFRIETYNPQHPIVDRYILDGAGTYQTFYALNKSRTDIAWKKYTVKSSLETTTVPVVITGLQNVITYIYGYTDRLDDLGWAISTDYPVTDAETGRNINWQLEIEKLVDRVYGGMDIGQGHILNPFMDKLSIKTPVGLLGKFSESNYIDAYSMQAAYDIYGKVIPVTSLNVIRTDAGATAYSNTPIFSAHVFIDEYEHAILMNQKFSDEFSSATVFDTFLGLRLNTAYLSFIRQAYANRKPTFDGFFISGNAVKRNMSSSISTISNYYDANQAFYEPDTARHGLALLGFTHKDYFKAINVNDTTQFNFWRGLIQAKGTNMAIDAFVNYKKFTAAATDEYWAYKIATFGDARERSFPEVKINSTDVVQKFTKLQFYSRDGFVDPLPLFTQVENMDDTRWYSVDDLGKGMKFEALPLAETVVATEPGYYRLGNIYHNGDNMSPGINSTAEAEFRVVNSSLIWVSGSGNFNVSGYTWNNPTKHSPIKLFDYTDNVLIEEISLWHPAIGIHTVAPLEIINIISNDDPAHYDYSTKTTNNPNYRTLKPWGQREVGRVFWDTSNLAYIPYYDATVFSDIEARHARWGALAEWASIDLYEWIESSVHPSEYNALAALEEGNSAIDESIRSSGKVAFANYYKRNRTITTRPIAWSYVPTGLANGHPSFEYAANVRVFKAGNQLIIDDGRAADIGISLGRSFGGWVINPVTQIGKPVGEVLIDAGVAYDIGSYAHPSSPMLPANVTISPIVGGLFGNRIGAIILSAYNDNGNEVLRMEDSSGFYQDVVVTEPASIDTLKTIKFDTFGLQVTITALPSTAAEIVAAICLSTNDIYVRETATFIETIPLQEILFVNDVTDETYTGTEWRTWTIPAQTQLDGDLLSPNNSWLPILGDSVTVIANATVVAAMKADSNTMTLKSGIAIKRFASSWTNWESLNQVKTETISDGTASIVFAPGGVIDSNRMSIYVNGVQVNPDGYVIDGLTATLVNKPAEGYVATMLYRAYQPTKDELSFNPDIADDVSIQVQFKLDYQYTQLDIRNEEGNITSKKYYFWVQDKTIPQINKSMSLVQAKALLKSGPSAFTIFSRLLPDDTAKLQPAAAFDSCAIAGLSMYVTKDNSFKLRMLKNFTLLDDPEELSLKNVHTEWIMIRKKQTSKIPAALWAVLTNAVCGTDIGGNLLPSQTRIDYDLRNGTRSKFGFGPGQVFADTQLLRTSVTHTLLNTQLTLHLVNKIVPDYITALDFSNSDKWFADATSARITMNLIWNTGRPHQVNEVFFDALEDALANNYEFSDLFKTSLITVNSSTTIADSSVQEQADELY